MFKPLALFIGLRYTRAKRNNHYISFISSSSMIGIALGVAVLITVLSVMNGFDEEIKNSFFGMVPEITITSYDGQVSNANQLEQSVAQFPGVNAVVPFVGGQGLLTRGGQVAPIEVTGILPQRESEMSVLADKMVAGQLDQLQAGQFGIVLGRDITTQLNLLVGDQVTLMIPQASVSPLGINPRFKRFTVVGIFAAGDGFNFDSKLAYINLADAQTLFQMGHDVSGLRIRIDNIYAAPFMSAQLASQLPPNYYVGNWTQQYGEFFHAIKLEKNMMFLILALVIAVAAFNLVSSLVMVVNDKRADIAILRTLGALPRTILAIFMVQGSIVGIAGLILGLIFGTLMAVNATEIVNWLQAALHVQFLSADVYFIDYLPSKVQWQDIVKISVLALLMSFVATIYPAWRASRIQPAEALRYE